MVRRNEFARKTQPYFIVHEYENPFFDVHVTVHRDKFLIIKPTRCNKFSNLFWKETLHVSGSSSVHHQEFFTAHKTMVYVTQAYWQLASCLQTCMTYTIAVCTVKNSWWWTEELSETCRVSFQNKFENLLLLVGFIIRKENPSILLIATFALDMFVSTTNN